MILKSSSRLLVLSFLLSNANAQVIRKTRSPTKTPTTPAPTTKSPTVSPTLNPTKIPTTSPTLNPTKLPSSQPTFSPTVSPSVSPTVTPSASPSLVPTLTPYVISMDGRTSTCRYQLPDNSTNVTETLAFEYYLTSPSSNTTMMSEDAAEVVVSDIEMNLHDTLSLKLLRCLFDDDVSSYSLYELSMGSPDSLSSSKVCESSSEMGNSSCWVVDAEMIVSAVFYGNSRRRRHLSSEIIINDLIPILSKTLEEFGGVFQGFTNLNTDGTTVGGGDSLSSNSNNNTTSDTDTTDKSEDIGIWFMLAVAAAALLFVVVIVLIQKCVRRITYKRKLKEVADLDIDYDLKMNVEGPGNVVDDCDNNPSDELIENIEMEKSTHDIRNCADKECETCQKKSKIVFIRLSDQTGGVSNFHRK